MRGRVAATQSGANDVRCDRLEAAPLLGSGFDGGAPRPTLALPWHSLAPRALWTTSSSQSLIRTHAHTPHACWAFGRGAHRRRRRSSFITRSSSESWMPPLKADAVTLVCAPAWLADTRMGADRSKSFARSLNWRRSDPDSTSVRMSLPKGLGCSQCRATPTGTRPGAGVCRPWSCALRTISADIVCISCCSMRSSRALDHAAPASGTRRLSTVSRKEASVACAELWSSASKSDPGAVLTLAALRAKSTTACRDASWRLSAYSGRRSARICARRKARRPAYASVAVWSAARASKAPRAAFRTAEPSLARSLRGSRASWRCSREWSDADATTYSS
mmetsp:Transcript_11762/g.40217  ORF Transcript_11762/g.40217 Transcript_11762/m.40217 type:complete len:334 (-) Transcript_11762:669-1670(-)